MFPVLDLDPVRAAARAIGALSMLRQALYMRDYMRKRRMTA